MVQESSKVVKRSEEIVAEYFHFIDQHIQHVVSGITEEFMELNQIASKLCISHQHLTDTIREETGNHPCHFYDLKIIEEAKRMLKNTDKPIAEIARILTYDPSNFSKFFKKFVGITPKSWRETS